VVEPDLRALALALRLHDWTAALADERVCLFAGDSAWEQWRELLRNDSALPEPGQVNSLPAWFGRPPSPAVEMLEQVAQYRKSLQARHRRRAREAYNGRDLTFWARRYETAGADDPLRVLFITSRFTTFLQHSTRDMMAALERAGIATRLLIEEKDHSLLPKHSYLEAIADFRPDMVLVLDHHRHEYPDGFIDNLPFVCWIQDELPHLFSADAGDRLGPLDFTIGFGLTRCVLNHRYPADRFMPCKLAINPAKFARPPDAGEPEAALRCDAAYVSHHSEPPEELHARLRRMAGSEQMCRLMDAFFEETRPLMTSPRFNAAWDLDGLLRRIEEQTGICCSDETARERLMGLYVRPLADRTIRHTTLAWVADWADATGRTLHVYGRNWDRHPRFGRYARGVAEHGRHLGEIARAAAINLHCGTTSTLHQRVLEVVSAGGFVMVRHATLFDCYTAEHAALEKYMREHGVTRPTRVPIDRFPEDYRRTMRRRVALTGRPLTDFAEITEEDLLEHGARRERDQRYYYANLAFPDLDRINFDGPESFRRRADEFIADPQRRRAIARRMQQAVHELFTYDALVPRVISFVSEVLTAQVPAAGR